MRRSARPCCSSRGVEPHLLRCASSTRALPNSWTTMKVSPWRRAGPDRTLLFHILRRIVEQRQEVVPNSGALPVDEFEGLGVGAVDGEDAPVEVERSDGRRRVLNTSACRLSSPPERRQCVVRAFR